MTRDVRSALIYTMSFEDFHLFPTGVFIGVFSQYKSDTIVFSVLQFCLAGLQAVGYWGAPPKSTISPSSVSPPRISPFRASPLGATNNRRGPLGTPVLSCVETGFLEDQKYPITITRLLRVGWSNE